MSHGYIHEDLKTEHTDELEAIGQTMKLYPVEKGTRFIHLIVDTIILIPIYFAVAYALGTIIGLVYPELLYNLVDTNPLVEYAFTYSIHFLYFFILESTTGQTVGKMITKTKVIHENGGIPTNKDIALRSVCRLIPFEAFSFLGSKDTGWHDRISKTYVVRKANLS